MNIQSRQKATHPSSVAPEGTTSAWSGIKRRRMLALGAASALLAVSAVASALTTQGTYSWWSQTTPSAKGYYNLDEVIYPANDPKPGPDQVNPAYFYSHQFDSINGDGGYIGLQTDVNGKRAIFSWWGAMGASCSNVPGAICQPFSGEGTGYQTMIPYNWQIGHYYRTRVWVVSDNPDGSTTWVGAIIDDTTHVEAVVGYIHVPTWYGWLSGGSVNWVEYYGPQVPSCNQLPLSIVYFAPPTANAGTISAGSPNNVLGGGQCPSSVSMYSTWAKHVNGQ